MKLSPKKEKQFLEKIRKIRELEKAEKEAKKSADSLKTEIKSYMEKHDTEELDVDIFKIRYATIESRKFDSEAFRKTHGELYKQYLKTATAKRFSIS